MSKQVALVAVLLLVLYGGFKVLPLLRGPSIALSSPADGQSFASSTLLVAGTASRTETLYLDGAILPIDAKGVFSKTLTLPQGGAILILTAVDRFGKRQTVRRSVFITN